MRWVFNFVEGQVRELAAAELAACHARRRRAIFKSIAWAIASILSFVLGIGGIAFASSGYWWGWAMLIVLTITFICCLVQVGNCQREGLFLRRCQRLACVTRFDRSHADEVVRLCFTSRTDASGESFEQTWWDADEKFEQRISKELGREPQWIELLADDEALYSIEGKPVSGVVDLQILMTTALPPEGEKRGD
jgi:hypothetical protein